MPPLHGAGSGSGGCGVGVGGTTTSTARRRSSRSNNGGISSSTLRRPAYAMMKWAVVTGMAVFSAMTLVVLFYHHGMVEPTAHHISLWGAGHREGKGGSAAGHASGRSLGGDSSPAATGSAGGGPTAAASDENVKLVASSSSSATTIFRQRLHGKRTGSYAGQ
ncbi:unnamed protein product, partial [Scytosiphon promiscuus]